MDQNRDGEIIMLLIFFIFCSSKLAKHLKDIANKSL